MNLVIPLLLVYVYIVTGDTCGPKVAQVKLEQCLIMLKPDAVQRGLVGDIIQRLERKGFNLVAMKFVRAERELLEQHYQEHAERPFFRSLVQFMQSGPVVPMVWEGENIVQIARMMLGATDPAASLPGTIRGDFGVSKQMNLCHVSDSVASANAEIDLWFASSEIMQSGNALDSWKFS